MKTVMVYSKPQILRHIAELKSAIEKASDPDLGFSEDLISLLRVKLARLEDRLANSPLVNREPDDSWIPAPVISWKTCQRVAIKEWKKQIKESDLSSIIGSSKPNLRLLN